MGTDLQFTRSSKGEVAVHDLRKGHIVATFDPSTGRFSASDGAVEALSQLKAENESVPEFIQRVAGKR